MDKRTSMIVTNANFINLNSSGIVVDPPLIKIFYRYLFTTSKNFTIDADGYLEWFWIHDQVPNATNVNNMLTPYVEYPFDMIHNRYNFFITMNQDLLNNATTLMFDIILSNDFVALESQQAYYVYLMSPINETHSFKTGKQGYVKEVSFRSGNSYLQKLKSSKLLITAEF
uniref:Uncharacterized protein n=1 Tax=Panagrolaimus sp. JU765 TaxID=591449 RepID=A0AC34QWA5_9BILA